MVATGDSSRSLQDYLLADVERTLSNQLESVAYLDEKAANVFRLVTGASGLLSFLALAAPYFGLLAPSSQAAGGTVRAYHEPFLSEPAFLLGLAGLVGALLFALLTRQAGNYYDGLRPADFDRLADEVDGDPAPADWKRDVVAALDKSVARNTERIRAKSKWYAGSVYCLATAILSLFAGLFNVAYQTPLWISVLSVTLVVSLVVVAAVSSERRGPPADEDAPVQRGPVARYWWR